MSFESELDRVNQELGVSGEVEDMAGTGYIEEIAGPGIGAKKVVGKPQIAVPTPGEKGDGVVWPLPCNAAVPLVAAAVGNLIFVPNRNVHIRMIDLDVYVAAAAAAAIMPAAIKVTGITVMGRPQECGIGECPLTSFRPSSPVRCAPRMENCASGQQIIVGLRNDDAATTHNVTGTVWCTTVK